MYICLIKTNEWNKTFCLQAVVHKTSPHQCPSLKQRLCHDGLQLVFVPDTSENITQLIFTKVI